jgi:hypothetical protein
MLFRTQDVERIERGEVTATIRAWSRPQAKAGGRYRVGAGEIEVTSVAALRLGDVTPGDLARAGFEDRAALAEALRRPKAAVPGPDAEVYRVEFVYHPTRPEDPREVLGRDAGLDAADVEALRGRLARMDGGAPWTLATLRLIAERPGTRAADLAATLGKHDVPHFKADVRRLKALGLTRSLEVGYELSARGRALVEALDGMSR